MNVYSVEKRRIADRIIAMDADNPDKAFKRVSQAAKRVDCPELHRAMKDYVDLMVRDAIRG